MLENVVTFEAAASEAAPIVVVIVFPFTQRWSRALFKRFSSTLCQRTFFIFRAFCQDNCNKSSFIFSVFILFPFLTLAYNIFTTTFSSSTFLFIKVFAIVSVFCLKIFL